MATAGATAAAHESAPSASVVHGGDDPIAHRVHGGLMSGIQQEDDRGNDLRVCQLSLRRFGEAESGDQVVARVGAAGGDQRGPPFGELPGGVDGGSCLLACRVEFIHLHDGVRPVEEQFGVIDRGAQQGGDDPHRVRLGIVAEEIEARPVAEAVQQSIGDQGDRCSEFPNPSRG